MPGAWKKSTVAAGIALLCVVTASIFLCACSKTGHVSDEIEKRQALSRDDIYSVEIATYGTLEEIMTRLDQLSASFPKYRNDLHVTTLKKPDGQVVYALRCGVFIRNQEATKYYEKFLEDTGLEEADLIEAE